MSEIAIVTGAGRGIGEAIAFTLADRGLAVVAAARTVPEIEQTVSTIQSKGHEAVAVQTDVSDERSVDELVDITLEKFGQIDVLVNNAGTGMLCPITEMTLEQWDTIINVDLRGVFLCSRAVGKIMIQQKRGKVINISSVSAHGGIPGMSAYCAAKGGVNAFTRAMAVEWADSNINVNSVSPGMIETPLIRKLRESAPELAERHEKMIPFGHAGQGEDVANLVAFLASEDSKYISGQDIIIDGCQFAIHPGYVGETHSLLDVRVS